MRLQVLFLMTIMFLTMSCGKDETPINSTLSKRAQQPKAQKSQSHKPVEDKKEIIEDKQEENKYEAEEPDEVMQALYWLEDHQNENGSWSANFHDRCVSIDQTVKKFKYWDHEDNKFKFYDYKISRSGKCANKDGSDDSGHSFSDELTTAFALLAFRYCYASYSGDYFGDEARKGIQYLMNAQLESGRFSTITDEYLMMTQAVCAYVLSWYAVDHEYDNPDKDIEFQSKLVTTVKKSFDYLFDSQLKNENEDFTGWGRADLSRKVDPITSGWVMYAIFSAKELNAVAKNCGIEIPKHALIGIKDYFKSIMKFRDGVAFAEPTFNYMPRGSENYKRMPICEALTGFLYLNYKKKKYWDRYDDYFKSLVIPLTLPENNYSSDDKYKIDYMYWYFAGVTRFNFQTYFEKDLYDAQFALQRIKEKDKGRCVYGSWDPIDAWGKAGGRVFSTAINIILDQLYRIARHRYYPGEFENLGRKTLEPPMRELSKEEKKERKNNEWKLLKELHE